MAYPTQADLDIINAALYRIGDKPTTLAELTTPTTDRARIATLLYEPTRDEELRLHPWIFALVRATLTAYTAPVATLTPGTGATVVGTTGVTFVASGSVFTTDDVGKTLEAQTEDGVALITAIATGGASVLATIVEAFPDLTVIAAGDWRLFNVAPANTWARSIDKPAGLLRLWDVRYRVSYRAEGDHYVTDADSLDVVYIQQITDPADFDPLFVEAFTARLGVKFAYGLTAKPGVLEEQEKLYTASLDRARQFNCIEQGEGRYEEDPRPDAVAAICQDAIYRLGDAPLPDKTDWNDLTPIVNHFYRVSRDELQRLHPWRFTRKKLRLDATTTTTLTPSAISGAGVTFTAGADVFDADTDVGERLLFLAGGVARITSVTSATVAVGTVEAELADTAAVAAGEWHIGPAWRYTWRYPKPTGFQRITDSQCQTWLQGVNTPVTWWWLYGWRPPFGEWERRIEVVQEGTFLCSFSGPTIDIEYVRLVTDPNAFDASYSSTLAALLAAKLALNVLKAPAVAQLMDQRFLVELKAARTADKLDEIKGPIRPRTLLDVRM